MTAPIPFYMSDRDYYARNDRRRAGHLAHIELQERLNRRIDASAGDGSYAVLVTRKDLPK